MAKTITELHERVRAATGPDRRIDRELSVLPGGPNWRHEKDGDVAYFRREDKGADGRTYAFASGPVSDDFGVNLNDNAWPYYTSSLDAVVALVEQVLPDWSWQIRRTGYAELTHPTHHLRDEVEHGKAPALALCAALLSAKIAQEAGH